MKKSTKRISTEFPLDEGLALRARWGREKAPPADDLENLKRRLASEMVRGNYMPGMGRRVRIAADEAASLAWATPYPTLMFPVLFEEKMHTAEAHAERQAEVSRVTRELLAV